jgi:polysaccharide export outer membrane protein
MTSMRIIPTLLALAIVATGCSTSRPANTFADLPIDPAALTQPTIFSDDISRDLVRQTQQLLVLKSLDYQVGPDDVLEISIFEWEMSEETKTLDFRVSETGIISLPAIGALHVGGKSIQQIQSQIERELEMRGVLQSPRVSVDVKDYRSRRISVIGEVNAPGVYAIHRNVSTLMDMLTLAGGPTADAGQIAYVLRKPDPQSDPVRITVDLEELFDMGKFELNAVLRGEDIVYVPKAPLIYVYGEVRAPGGYALRRSLRSIEAVALAGGMTEDANKSRSYLVRRTPGKGETIVPLDFVVIETGRTPDLYLKEGDVIHVPQSASRVAWRETWDAFRGVFTFSYRLNSED